MDNVHTEHYTVGIRKANSMDRSDMSRDAKFQIRARPLDLDVIDAAADRLGKSRSEFVMETARQRAEDVLRDQSVFYLDDAAWRAFIAELDKSPADNPGLKKLFATRAPWAK